MSLFKRHISKKSIDVFDMEHRYVHHASIITLCGLKFVAGYVTTHTNMSLMYMTYYLPGDLPCDACNLLALEYVST